MGDHIQGSEEIINIDDLVELLDTADEDMTDAYTMLLIDGIRMLCVEGKKAGATSVGVTHDEDGAAEFRLIMPETH